MKNYWLDKSKFVTVDLSCVMNKGGRFKEYIKLRTAYGHIFRISDKKETFRPYKEK